ncbi:MAG: hypothetical protein IKO47_02180 [Ruminococcus sp.]|nr:hypothetical protein [Ruminococcus sp.]
MNRSIRNRLISVMTSLTFVLSTYHCVDIKANSVNLMSDAAANEISAEYTPEKHENPFNRQNDAEVIYDSKCWIQPREWNSPKIDPKDYDGGIMMFFDKIGLEPENYRGKECQVYFSLTGATEAVSRIKLHVFYDTRLTVNKDSNGKYMTPGEALDGFTTDSAMVEEGELVFYGYSANNIMLDKCCIFKINFTVPENAEPGEIYPFGISYVVDDVAADTFINTEQDDAGRLQMTYLFTKGIYNGYIRMQGEKIIPPPKPVPGDIDENGLINAIDASKILVKCAELSAPDAELPKDDVIAKFDINGDGLITAVDASFVLAYCADLANDPDLQIEDFIASRKK